MKSESYYCDVAGLEIHFETDYFGPNIRISGFNDKALLLLKKSLNVLRNSEIPIELFNNVKEQLVRSYQSDLVAIPYRRISSIVQRTTCYLYL